MWWRHVTKENWNDHAHTMTSAAPKGNPGAESNESATM